MRKIFAIALKDALLRFASRSEILFFLILPLTFTVLIGGAPGGRRHKHPAVLLVGSDPGPPNARGPRAPGPHAAHAVRPGRCGPQVWKGPRMSHAPRTAPDASSRPDRPRRRSASRAAGAPTPRPESAANAQRSGVLKAEITPGAGVRTPDAIKQWIRTTVRPATTRC